MENKNLPVMQSKDIEEHYRELPTVQLGIGSKDDQSEYIQIRPKKEECPKLDLQESSDSYSHAETDLHAGYAVDGNDYQEDLERLHKRVKPYVLPGNKSNGVDNYIYDTLKKGVPSGDTVKHIVDVIHNTPTSDDKTYLEKKWTPLLLAHAAKDQQFKRSNDAEFTHDEVKNTNTEDLIPLSYRVFKKTGTPHYFEKHPTEGLKYLGTVGGGKKFLTNSTGYDHPDFHKEEESLSTAYSPFHSDDVFSYTNGSAALNRYLHKKHQGETYHDDDTVLGKDVSELDRVSEGVSKHFKHVQHPTHIGDFHVYTGVYAETNPTEHITHKDEHGNALFHNPSFTSTSIDRDVALGFAGVKGDSDLNKRVADVLKVKIPGGYPKGAYVASTSDHAHEKEYLLDKGHTFKIKPNPKYYLHEGKFIREWEAELHHTAHDSHNFDDSDKQTKISKLLAADAKPEDLEKGAASGDTELRAAAAKHPSLSSSTLVHLAKNDESNKVRHAAYRNPNLPDHVIEHALNVEDPAATSIAERPHLSDHHRELMAKSSYDSISAALAKRHDLLDHHIQSLFENGESKTHAALARNESLDPDFLHEFIHHPDVKVRTALAGNHMIHKHTAEHLVDDESAIVRTTARLNRARRKLD